ncbi:MAG: hypothetical protein QT00_C0002G0462 [archaeon GW2011_AR5]|nr:MAG: hypothetical protein QT00_C0002G0462 [archaeon GW2011_AR5]
MDKVKITLEGYRCARCKYEWVPRLEAYPKVCPHCKSPYWDKPRKKAKDSGTKTLKDSK